MLLNCLRCPRTYLAFRGQLHPTRLLSSVSNSSSTGGNQAPSWHVGRAVSYSAKCTVPPPLCNTDGHPDAHSSQLLLESRRRGPACVAKNKKLLQREALWPVSFVRQRMTEAPLSTVQPTFVVMRFDQKGTVTSFEKKKNELCQELSLQARDLRFLHSTSLATRNNCIIIRMESLKAIITPLCLLVLDFRGLGLEHWLVLELASQLASQTHSLPFEFRALEAILQHRVNNLQTRLNEVEPVILDILESLVDPKILSADRSKLHILLQNSKSEESSLGIDHAEEMELLLDNYYMQAEELGNKARELKGLIDDSESVIFIILDSHRNVMMRLNLQLTMGTFSLSLFGLIGVAFGMNLESSFEEDRRVFWLVTGFMFLGSGLIWRRLLSFLGRQLEPTLLPPIPPVWKRNLKASEMKPGVK
ncbi:magnesium transporter MRS2 homolog, mitochondrial isoform X2 [Nerophis lumbriciformis]|uniref:magnesium transporter MRS2 homolog, mitochondrial isoform X2 n=1 Tax=Nerophis lumbriciformis TaxID=546530 RepID=UPI002ADF8456|nr:magnesium transporter MRS2 homolog, mitochondrial-like isoform X2 [Nerophis lumbriciformis]